MEQPFRPLPPDKEMPAPCPPWGRAGKLVSGLCQFMLQVGGGVTFKIVLLYIFSCPSYQELTWYIWFLPPLVPNEQRGGGPPEGPAQETNQLGWDHAMGKMWVEKLAKKDWMNLLVSWSVLHGWQKWGSAVHYWAESHKVELHFLSPEMEGTREQGRDRPVT